MDVRNARALMHSVDAAVRDDAARPCSPRRLSIILTAVVALVGALVGSVLLLRRGGGQAALVVRVGRDNDGELQAKLCEKFPLIKYEAPNAVLNNNLGNKGPDFGKGEGLAFQALAVTSTAAITSVASAAFGSEDDPMVKEILLTINATSGDYRPFAPMLNGVSGRYGAINLNSGSEVDLTFAFYDRRSMQRLTMRNLAITWFDLDTGGGEFSQEYLISRGHESYHLSETSEVRVKQQPDGRTRFSGSVAGVGENNPKDPLFLTQEQRNRAVTVLYGDTDSLQVTIGATAGSGPRFFNFFHGKPSILCAATVQPDFRPLPDLSFSLPMEGCVMAGQGETFLSFEVQIGQRVKRGTVIARTRKGDEKLHYRAAFEGTVTQLQALEPEDELDRRLGERILAVVRRPSLRPLPVSRESAVEAGGPGEDASLTPHARFVKYLVEVGDRVFRGEPIAVAKDSEGNDVQVKATGYGMVHARQEDMREDQLLWTATDLNLITLAPFPALGPLDEFSAASAEVPRGQGFVFCWYHVRTGDRIRVGDRVATVRDGNGTEHLVASTHHGLVSSLQALKEGTPLDRVEDGNLCTVGKFSSLPMGPGMSMVSLARRTQGLTFLTYHVRPGDVVETGDIIAEVQYPYDVKLEVPSPRPGVVKHIHNYLREGMLLETALRDTNLATLGRLPALKTADAEQVAFAPREGSWALLEWRVHTGDYVRQGDPIALLEDRVIGARTEVRANRSGLVVQMHEHLRPGDIVENATEANDLAIIGLLRGPHVGRGEKGVDVPDLECTFAGWRVRVGDRVHPGDVIAVVQVPQGRIAAAHGSPVRSLLTESQSMPVSTSVGGWVNYRAYLMPGHKISEQTLSPTIATVQQGCSWWGLATPECTGSLSVPWWLWLLLLLIPLCILPFCLRFLLKPRELCSYKPMAHPMTDEPPAPLCTRDLALSPSPGPSPSPTPRVDEVRLDFEERGARRTVFARYRPLGLQHRHVAPIVVEGFPCNSYARQELGVQPGWKLARVGDCELKDSSDFAHVTWQLDIRTRELPIWPLQLEFRRHPNDSGVHTCSFLERPLGIQLGDTAPVKVLKVHRNGLGEAQCIKAGWYLTKVGDYEVQSGHSFKEVMSHLSEGLEGLPQRGS